MMSARVIRQMSDEAAERAAREGRKPYVFWNVDEVRRAAKANRFPIPNLGSLRPDGWELAEHRLVDKTGLGADYEPALTHRQFAAWVEDEVANADGETFGFAIIEEGQFQVVIGKFRKTGW